MAKKKTKDVVVDFDGIDPASGGSRFSKIPEGTYQLKCVKAEVGATRSGKAMLSVTLTPTKGESKGKKIRDMFSVPEKGGSTYPLQRLLGFVIACGGKRLKGKVRLASIAKAVEGKECIAEVADNTLPETPDQKERVISSPVEYFALKSKEGKAALSNGAKSEDEDDEEDEEDEEEDSDDDSDEGDDEDEEDDDEEDEDEEDEEEEKPAKSKKAKSKGKSKKADDDDDDLYDDDDDEDED